MQKKVFVISLGGSRIIPEEVDYEFVKKFKEIIFSSSYKFVIVTGGGSTARKYIDAIKKFHKSTKAQSIEGISITRFHASFIAHILGKKANEEIPKNLKKIKDLLEKNQVVVTGSLRWKKDNTSDGTAASIANYLNCSFINITNVAGLYTANPKTDKNAKLIKNISWREFEKITSKIKYSAGQHFVLDQTAAKEILKNKIPTYIIGSLSDLKNILSGKKFNGTLIKD